MDHTCVFQNREESESRQRERRREKGGRDGEGEKEGGSQERNKDDVLWHTYLMEGSAKVVHGLLTPPSQSQVLVKETHPLTRDI